MLSVKLRRVFLAQHRVDFRRRFDGLLSEALQLGADPYDGDCVLFVKRDHTQLRAIVGDSVGLYLICRRFEGGRLRNLAAFARDPQATEISTAELSLLLEGASFTVHQRARVWRQRDLHAAPSDELTPTQR
ncbi:MAG TPA: IS66 family insertion sequence element accessory protein TnpB [Polyangiales bacterium]